MDEAKRPFLTARDRDYLDELFEALTAHHRLTPDLAAQSVRGVADVLHRKRMSGATDAAPQLFWCADLAEHATALAALTVVPRVRRAPSFVLLALLATVVGALGARIALDLVFRRFGPMGIGAPDLALIAAVAAGVFVVARIGGTARLLQGAGVAVVLVGGALLGVVAGRLLRPLGVSGNLVMLPFWLAVLVAVICGSLLWLLTMPTETELMPEAS